MSTPRKKSFRTNLFSPDNITSIEDVENSIFELQSTFTEQNYEHVLDELLQTPFLVELVLSGTFLVFHPPPPVRTHQTNRSEYPFGQNMVTREIPNIAHIIYLIVDLPASVEACYFLRISSDSILPRGSRPHEGISYNCETCASGLE